MTDLPWVEIDHTADWALKVAGSDLPRLFEHAAKGMVALIGGKPERQQPVFEKNIKVQAPDLETLLVDWLTELIYLVEDDHIIFSEIMIESFDDLTLNAHVKGQSGSDIEKHIKAVTYHNLNIEHNDDGYSTTIVFDV